MKKETWQLFPLLPFIPPKDDSTTFPFFSHHFNLKLQNANFCLPFLSYEYKVVFGLYSGWMGDGKKFFILFESTSVVTFLNLIYQIFTSFVFWIIRIPDWFNKESELKRTKERKRKWENEWKFMEIAREEKERK